MGRGGVGRLPTHAHPIPHICRFGQAGLGQDGSRCWSQGELGCPGGVLGLPEAPLDSSRLLGDALGLSCLDVGLSCACLGLVLKSLGAPWSSPWGSCGCHGVSWGCIVSVLRLSWGVLGLHVALKFHWWDKEKQMQFL